MPTYQDTANLHANALRLDMLHVADACQHHQDALTGSPRTDCDGQPSQLTDDDAAEIVADWLT